MGGDAKGSADGDRKRPKNGLSAMLRSELVDEQYCKKTHCAYDGRDGKRRYAGGLDGLDDYGV